MASIVIITIESRREAAAGINSSLTEEDDLSCTYNCNLIFR